MTEKMPAAVIFKAFSQNKEPLKYLSDFVSQAEQFNEKNTSYDIIKEYIQISGNCQEILEFAKEISVANIQIAGLTLQALYHILLRIASDLNVYTATGTSIVNEVLSHGMKTIFNFLKSKQKSSRTKIALHLLASMIALGGQTAQQVVAKLDFTNVNFTHLLNRMNFAVEENVRTSFLNLIVLILSMCSNNVIRQIVEVKGFLNHVFPGLHSDAASTITLVLDTFRIKIIENPNLPKTCKVRLFNDNTLGNVIKLYTWKGPVRNKVHKKRKLGEDINPIVFEVDEEVASEVHASVHQFLLSLCTTKNGIIFNDASYGFSGKNINHTITNVLQSFKNPYSHHLISEFVKSTLKACPDQLKFYLPTIKDSFKPRLSKSWVNALGFLKEIMKLHDPVSAVFKTSTKRPVSVLVNVAKTFCMLDILNEVEIINVLNSGHHVLSHYLCCYILNVLEQVQIVMEFTGTQDPGIPYGASDILSFNHSFLSLVLQSFPVLNELQNYWHKISSGLMEIDEEIIPHDLPVPSRPEELLTILKVMKLIQPVYLKCNKDFNVDLTKMLSDIKESNDVLPSESIKNIYIDIISLLSAQNSLTLWNKDTSNTPLMTVVDLYQSAHKNGDLLEARDIVYKVLLHTKVFDQCKWEIDTWLDSLEYSKSRHIPHLFEFINETLLVLFQQPRKFQVEASNREPTLDITDTSDDEERVLNQTEQEQCFSSFVPASLFILQSFEKKGCQLFVERALVLIMHHQHLPQIFFRIVKPYESVISPSLLAYWEVLSSPNLLLGNVKQEIFQKQPSRVPCTLDLSGHLRRNFIANYSPDIAGEVCSCNLKSLLKELNINSLRKVIWQILMYIDYETILILDKIKEGAAVSVCTNIILLKQLIEFLSEGVISKSHDLMDSDAVNKTKEEISDRQQNITLVYEIMTETLRHPVMLKLFMDTVPSNLNLKQSVVASTELVLNMTKRLLDSSDKNCFTFLLPYKKKIFCLIQDKTCTSYGGINYNCILETFSPFFKNVDIATLLEKELSCDKDVLDFTCVILLLKIFLEKGDSTILSSKCFCLLISKYTMAPKKLKKIIRCQILQFLNQHPEYSLAITQDAASLLLQQKTSKDLVILGRLISSNDKFRHITQHYLTKINVEEASTDIIILASKCILNCETSNDSDINFKELILSRFWKIFVEYMLDTENEADDMLKQCSAGKAAGLILQEKHSSPKKLNSFIKMLLEKDVPNPSKMCVLLQLFESWKLYEMDTGKTMFLILKVTCSWLYSTISEDFACLELTSLMKDVLKNSNSKFEIGEIIDISEFFLKNLKIALKYVNIGKDVVDVLALLCEKSKEGTLPVHSIYGLVTGHSSFFQIMLANKVEENLLKESIIDLLITLTVLDSTVCKENHIGLFLSAYGATMTAVDQKLLFLMKLYADNGINMIKFSPFLWGKPAIGHYSIMKNTEMPLWKRPKLQDVLSLLLPEMIDCTILNYPLNITLQPLREPLEMEKSVESKIYDLRFILQLFANLLAPGCFVQCHKFVEHRVLMLIFSSLSCHDSDTRALGYYCLSQFYNHLESENFREKQIWLCMLESIRNSITSINPKIPCIITLFLARMCDIFTKPDHHMFVAVSKFITIKPFLDITQVPEFYKLFNSIELEHRIQRQWLLRLIGDGLRTSADFQICEKRYIFNILQHYYFSSLSTTQEKVAIIHILCSAVKMKTSSNTLCERGLLIWIQGAIMQSDLDILKSLELLMCNLQKTIDEKFLFQSTQIHSNLMERLS